MRVGDRVGSLIVKKLGRRFIGGRWRHSATVVCIECSKDVEMYGEATYEVTICGGKLRGIPCGCGFNFKRSRKQWEILLRRKAESENKMFLGFHGEFKGNTSKIILHCNSHNFTYKSCSAANFLRGRDCPKCAESDRSENRKLSGDELELLYMKSGAFHFGTKFRRLAGRNREVFCPECEDTFVADHSNLVMGKNPCNCKKENRKPFILESFYIIEVTGEKTFTGFGVTRFPKRRELEHKANLRKFGCEVTDFKVYAPNGNTSSRDLETELKSLKLNYNTGIEGFQLEAFLPEYREVIVNKLTNNNFRIT